jgi:hypothetical protein
METSLENTLSTFPEATADATLHMEVANTSLCNDATDSNGRFGRLPAAHSSDQRHRSKGSKI